MREIYEIFEAIRYHTGRFISGRSSQSDTSTSNSGKCVRSDLHVDIVEKRNFKSRTSKRNIKIFDRNYAGNVCAGSGWSDGILEFAEGSPDSGSNYYSSNNRACYGSNRKGYAGDDEPG